MHDPSAQTHKFFRAWGSAGRALHHTAAVYSVSLGSGRKTKEERVGKDLAGEIKISVGRRENYPFAVQSNRARGGTLLFIFLFTAALTFLSPFPPARRSQSIAFDLGGRILRKLFLSRITRNFAIRFHFPDIKKLNKKKEA